MILATENIFLIILAVVWIIGAVLQDLKRREVDNLWNFSLIAFALAYRFAISVHNGEPWFLINGVLGFLIFLFLGNLFYYTKLFAGGDAKLLIALGAILPLSYNWLVNFEIFGIFIVLFLALGSVYALVWALVLVVINRESFKKEISKQWWNYKKLFIIAVVFAILWTVFVFAVSQVMFIFIGLIVLLFPVLFMFARAVEESCMIKKIPPRKVTEGDWLYKDIVVNKRKIKANWEGLTKKELKWIQRHCKRPVLIKQGIPFTPSFLLAIIALIFISWKFGVV
jgi:Flp pilus assembly protein protease CpaA